MKSGLKYFHIPWLSYLIALILPYGRHLPFEVPFIPYSPSALEISTFSGLRPLDGW